MKENPPATSHGLDKSDGQGAKRGIQFLGADISGSECGARHE
jgi:6-phosphogluconate dehydrogenase